MTDTTRLIDRTASEKNTATLRLLLEYVTGKPGRLFLARSVYWHGKYGTDVDFNRLSKYEIRLVVGPALRRLERTGVVESKGRGLWRYCGA